MRCLEKHAADRWQSATELRSQLGTTLTITPVSGAGAGPIVAGRSKGTRRLVAAGVVAVAAVGWGLWGSARGGATTETDLPSIAVLPFVDMSPSGDQAYFGDGVAEEILNALNRLQNLRVASRTSTFKLRDEEVQTIGDRLNVQHVLEGSIRLQGEAVRVTARLTAVESGSNLWSKTFDGSLNDVFGIQEEISRSVVDELRVRLLGDEGDALAERGTDDIGAYNHYLRGRFQWNQRTAVSLRGAIESFEAAVRLDPGYAMAHVGIADAYGILGGQALAPPHDVFPAAKDAVSRALELDPDLAQAHRALAWILYAYDYDWSEAEREFRLALELSPSDAFAHYWYAILLDTQGRHAEAETEVLLARQLDPVALQIAAGVASHFLRSGQYEEAVEQFQSVIGTDPTFQYARQEMARTYLALEEHSKALEQIDVAERLGRPLSALRAQALWGLGREQQARAMIARAEAARDSVWTSAISIAGFYADAGDVDNALRWLNTAIDEREILYQVASERFAPRGSALRSDPRFRQMLEDLGLGAALER